MLHLLVMYSLYKVTSADVTPQEVQFLNELPLDKLLRLKNSLQDLVTENYDNFTTSTPSYLERFGAQAMAMKGPPIKRGDHEVSYHKKDGHSKISNLFSISVTTLAFLAFGGYLLCLIVQAIKAKHSYNQNAVTVQPTTFFLNGGLKKRPQNQFSAYGRKRRERERRSLKKIDLPPEELFAALLHLCEGYTKWSEINDLND